MTVEERVTVRVTWPQALRLTTRDGKWGVYDEQDELWLGTAEGPLRYDEQDVARAVAEAAVRMSGWPSTRVRVREIDRIAHRKLREMVITPLEVLKRVEGGYLW
jgi:hypothetical protein